MNDNWTKIANSKSVDIDYRTFISLPRKVQEYIAMCAHCGIQNPQNEFNKDDIVIRTFGAENMTDTDPYGVPLKWKVVSSIYGLVVGRKIRTTKHGSCEIVNSLNIPNAKAKIDPDYLNSLILQDETFDPSEQRKANAKEKRKASRYNKSISKPMTSIDVAAEFLSSLSTGDKFYVARSYLKLTTSSRLLMVKLPFNGHAVTVVDTDVVPVQFYFDYSIRPLEILGKLVSTEEPYPLSRVIYDETI
jgi:hypothetical protein